MSREDSCSQFPGVLHHLRHRTTALDCISWMVTQLLCMPADVLHHSGHRAAHHSSPQCSRLASLPVPVLDIPSRCQCHPSLHPQVLPHNMHAYQAKQGSLHQTGSQSAAQAACQLTSRQGNQDANKQLSCVPQVWLAWQVKPLSEHVVCVLQIWLAGVHAHSQQLQHLCCPRQPQQQLYRRC